MSTVRNLIIVLAAVAGQALAAAADAPGRPRVGLVLGGGGAKGLAHIGVIQVLDELRIPIDCVAGTSMGALVGAAFAGGMPPDELQRETLAIDWERTIGGKGGRDEVSIERKLARKTYTNSLEMGFNGSRFGTSSGVINTQDIEDSIRGLVSEARYQRDFDDLPIPFRAVATDMVAGEMVVLGSGDISTAMRASMALPGLFAPVETADGKVLADGGLWRNLPVDVGRDLCADVVIAVWLSSPAPKPEQLRTALALVSRSSDVMVEANEKQQLATLTQQDVEIEVPMGDIGTLDFGRGEEAIKLGRDAANAVAAKLQRYAVTENDYRAWRASHNSRNASAVTLAEVRVTGLQRVNPEFVQSQFLKVAPGAVVTTSDIAADTRRIFALGDFDRVEYRLSGPREARVLEIHPVEKSWGPHFFRGDLGLAVEGSGDLMAILRFDHDLTWVNRLGGRWHNTLQVGRETIVQTDFYQPLDVRQRFFVQPMLRYESNLEGIYVDGEREARYYLRELYGRFDIGLNLDTRSQLRAGARVGWIDTRLDTGSTLLPDLDTEGESSIFLNGVYDTRDNVGLPTRGSYASAHYTSSGSWLSGDQDYSFAEGVVTRAFPFRGNSLNVFGAAGKEMSGTLPPTRDFLIGGVRSFPGLNMNELRGSSYWLAGAHYRHRIADILSLFNQSLYAGVRFQGGRVGDRRDQVADGTIYGLSGNVSARTPVGAFILSVGWVSNHSWALQFALGAPLPEGNALDQIN